MDVVKTNLDRLGGKVEIDSEPGTGTTFRIKLPLTLAIIPSLIVTVQDERFAIPQVNVDGAPAHRGRPGQGADRGGGRRRSAACCAASLIPIVRLADVLGSTRPITTRKPAAGARPPGTPGRPPSRTPPVSDPRLETSPGDAAATNRTIAATRAPARAGRRPKHRRGFRRGAPVRARGRRAHRRPRKSWSSRSGGTSRNCRGTPAATIMGDGQVALILDVSGLAAMAGSDSVWARTERAGAGRAGGAEKRRTRSRSSCSTTRPTSNAPCRWNWCCASSKSRPRRSRRSAVGGPSSIVAAHTAGGDAGGRGGRQADRPGAGAGGRGLQRARPRGRALGRHAGGRGGNQGRRGPGDPAAEGRRRARPSSGDKTVLLVGHARARRCRLPAVGGRTPRAGGSRRLRPDGAPGRGLGLLPLPGEALPLR